MMRDEHDYALAQKTWLDRQLFRPQQRHYQNKWRVYDQGVSENWYRFETARNLDGLPPEILFAPLRGHTFGHAEIAIQCEGKWLLNAADAYFYHDEINPVKPCCKAKRRY